MKIFQGIILAALVGVSGWVITTVHALDKSSSLVEYRLELVEKNYKMLKDLWEEAGYGEQQWVKLLKVKLLKGKKGNGTGL